MITESEWLRKHGQTKRSRPDWWGAQYVLSSPKRMHMRNDPSFRLFLVLLSCVIAVMLPVMTPRRVRDCFEQAAVPAASLEAAPRSLNAVTYSLPGSLDTHERIFHADELARGKMMMLDENHELPSNAPPPNTFRVAVEGKGMVPVSSLDVKSGKETIQALEELFDALRRKGVSGLTVWQGTLSTEQQKSIRRARMRSLMQTRSIPEALAETLQETETPGQGELMQEYTVELRFRGEGSLPDPRPLEATHAGQTLLQNAWRHGFIRSAPDGERTLPYRFRYVGKAHATAMTFLNLSMNDYLAWLHRQGVMTIWENRQPRYLILCKPITGTHIAFDLPVEATIEASLDNEGYAIVACILPIKE